MDYHRKAQLSLFQFALRYLKRLFALRAELPKLFRLSITKCEG